MCAVAYERAQKTHASFEGAASVVAPSGIFVMDTAPEGKSNGIKDGPRQRGTVILVVGAIAVAAALTAIVLFAAGHIIDWTGMR